MMMASLLLLVLARLWLTLRHSTLVPGLPLGTSGPVQGLFTNVKWGSNSVLHWIYSILTKRHEES